VVAHPALVETIEETLVNAKHNDADVEVSITVSDESPETISVVVADTGRGIAESERDVLNTSGDTSLSHGLGLGLWLIY
jgi:signal transduction histidine kinase